MNFLKIAAACSFMVVLTLAQGCKLDFEFLQNASWECFTELANKTENIPFLKATRDYFRPDDYNVATAAPLYCNFRESLVNLYMCVVDKTKECKPQISDSLDYFVSRERSIETLELLCDNKHFLQESCVDEHYQNVMVCSWVKLFEIQSETDVFKLNSKALTGYACSLISFMKRCIRDVYGSCSEEFVAFSIEALEKLFPTELCDTADTKDPKNDEL